MRRLVEDHDLVAIDEAEAEQRFLEQVRGDLGPCRLGEPQLFAPRSVTYGLRCDRGAATMRVSLSTDQPSRIAGFYINKEPGPEPCDP